MTRGRKKRKKDERREDWMLENGKEGDIGNWVGVG